MRPAIVFIFGLFLAAGRNGAAEQIQRSLAAAVQLTLGGTASGALEDDMILHRARCAELYDLALFSKVTSRAMAIADGKVARIIVIEGSGWLKRKALPRPPFPPQPAQVRRSDRELSAWLRETFADPPDKYASRLK